MIISDLQSWGQEKHVYSTIISQAIQWVERNIDTSTPPGKYPIDGDQVYVMVQQMNTEPRTNRRAESHQQYIDIQLLLSGQELIAVARNTGRNEIISDELEKRDALFYDTVEHESDIVLTEGMFVVLFPADIHRPCCSVDEEVVIRKAVIKIHVNLL